MSNRSAVPTSSVVSAAFFGSAVVAAAFLNFGAGPPPAAGAESLCVLLIDDEGGETLINRCRDCRQVTLSRSRPGQSVPNIREMMLPPATATATPFRGPGRTRVVGDRSCPPPLGRSLAKAGYPR